MKKSSGFLERTHISSGSRKFVLWHTPPELFSLLDREFHFDLDVAATPEKALCPIYFTKEQDALSCNWNIYGPDTTVFCNPPGSLTGDFLLKGREEAKGGVTSVFLVRADAPETKWWRDGVLKCQENVLWNYPAFVIRFLTPRVNFLNPEGIKQSGITFPSAIVIIGQDGEYHPDIYWWNWKAKQ